MAHPEPLQQAARELTVRYCLDERGCIGPSMASALCEALLTEPRDEWRDAMACTEYPNCPENQVCDHCQNVRCTYACDYQPPTEQPEPSEDYRRKTLADFVAGLEREDYYLSDFPADMIQRLRNIFCAQPTPEDPNLLLAREAVAQVADSINTPMLAQETRDGKRDDQTWVQSALLALKLKEQSKP